MPAQTRLSFPLENYEAADCVLVPINATLVPFISGALEKYFQREYWRSPEDYWQAYNAFSELRACMTGRCIKEYIESNNRIYRLLDSALNGTAYQVVTDPDTQEQTITPAIPAAPALFNPTGLGLRARLERVVRLLDNLITGATYAVNDDDIRNTALADGDSLRGLVRDVRFALRGNDQPEDNVLLALRGTIAATATRNIIDRLVALGGAGLDQAILDELIEIRRLLS